MSNIIFFSAIFLIVFLLFIKALRSFLNQRQIRRLLKKEIRSNKTEIRQARGNQSQLFEIYKRIYNAAIYRKRKFRKMRKRQQFEKKVNDELNRMTKNPFTALFSLMMSFVRGSVSVVLLVATLLVGFIAVDEFKASSLTLPTIDKDVQLKLNRDFEDSAKKFFNNLLYQGPNLPKYNFADIDEDNIEPVYSNLDYPSAITNAEQLAQAYAYHMSNFENEFTINYQGDVKNFEQLNDEVFDWLSKNEVYLSQVLREMTAQYYSNGRSKTIQVTMAYHLDHVQNATVQGKVKQIIEAMPTDLSDVEKVKYVNDYLVVNTKYNINSTESPYSPFSILMNGEGVCQGYALATLLMLEEVGVEVKYVTGEARPGGLHAWNLVKLEGQWYHLDVTWNDPQPDQGDKVRYDYFLVSDEQISKDHDWNKSNYPKSAGGSYL